MDMNFPPWHWSERPARVQASLRSSAFFTRRKKVRSDERASFLGRLFWDPAGNRVPRPAEFARRRGRALVEARHVWLMARQWGVLFEVRHLMLGARGGAVLPVLGLQQLGARGL